MNLKKSPSKIQDKNSIDLDYEKDYPTLADLMKKQKFQAMTLFQFTTEEI